MEDYSPFRTGCIFQPLPEEHWWSAGHLAPLDTPGDKSSTVNGVYTKTAPLLDGFVDSYDADSTDRRWDYINPMINSTSWWNGLDSTTEYVPPLTPSKHIIAKDLPPLQVYSYLPSTAKDAIPKQNHDSNDLSTHKSARRSNLAYENVTSEPKNNRQSTICRTMNTSSNGVHPAQQGNDRINNPQERNRITAYKFRIKQREDISRLNSRTQELERVHHELSTCVADLSLQVYELKMQILQQSGCNCTLMRNYLTHESRRYVQALVEEPQSAVLFLQAETPMRCEQK
ncbi:hypothetical protein FIE12Z_10603 [Fusarium flagelliforme]|uniref:BZIP domain-containing protein n=2 Tax=Fusarium flagelliforme TaxID=2675880 RepID=A0A395MB64_9HYPO|nr:hypothetical protein FIE12Z_10603 [Fusarium flagelliforme]